MSAVSGMLRVGQVNAIIRVTLREDGGALDISSASVKQFKFRKPDGTVVLVNCDFTTTGVDGTIQYLTVANDLDQDGPWKGQPYVEMGGEKFHGSEFGFDVGKIMTVTP